MNFTPTVQLQRTFFQSGATRSLDFRRAQLRKLQDALVANESTLLTALHADLRKSAHDAYFGEIGFVLSEIRYALRHLPAWMKPQRRGLPLLAWR
jgi:aldehyde dehydrogenase (NAD+)